MEKEFRVCGLHSGLEAQLDGICAKLEWIIKSIESQLRMADKALEVAKAEMERRLDGMNHLGQQLNEQRIENRTKITELTTGMISRNELKLMFDGYDNRLDAMKSILDEKKGSSYWANHILTALIALGIFIMSHYVFKF